MCTTNGPVLEGTQDGVCGAIELPVTNFCTCVNSLSTYKCHEELPSGGIEQLSSSITVFIVF
jgi:hypothetical protein